MKKSLLILAAIAAAAFVSCNKETAEKPIQGPEETTEQTTPGGVLSEFSFAVARELPATKSYLDGNDFLWEDGEAIAVCYGTSVVKFTYSASTERFSSSEFDESAAGPFYVVAPYRDNITISSGKVVTELPALQTAGDYGVDSNALLSVGKADDLEALEAGVSLKNAFSLVKVGISDTDVDRISIDGNYEGTSISPVIAGPVTVDPADGGVTVSGRVTSVSLVPANGSFAAGDYILAVLPQAMTKGIKMVFRRSGEAKSYYRNSSKSITFERNKGIAFSAVNVAGLDKRCYFVTDAEDLQAWNVTTPDAADITWFGADIDMSGQTWAPRSNFVGTLDGQNHWLYNISVTTNAYCGFIKTTDDEGTAEIKNFAVGTVDGSQWDNVSTFMHSGSTSTGSWNYVGIVAKVMGATTMENIINYAKVVVAEGSQSETRIGGIVGNWASTKDIKYCTNYGIIRNEAKSSGSKNGIGGIAGQYDGSGIMDSCENFGLLFNDNNQTSFIGGVIGCTSQNTTFSNCNNFGDIDAENFKINAWGAIGGVLGYLKKGTADNCVCRGCTITNKSDITGENNSNRWRVNTGGVIGYIEAATVKNSVANGVQINAVKTYDVGGIVGITEAAPVIQGCKVIGGSKVNGNQRTGGVVGYMMEKTNAKVIGCEVTGSYVNGTSNVGGIAGWLDTGTISDCHISEGTLIEASQDGVGGIVGRAIAKGGTANLSSGCLVDGNSIVKGRYSVGGIVGYEYPDSNGPVDIYNCGVVDSTIEATACDSGGDPAAGDSMVGGIVGWARCSDPGSSFKIVNCFANCIIVCDLNMVHASAGGALGYCSLTDEGSGLIANFSTSLTSDSILVGGAPIGSGSDRYGAVYGLLPNRAITVSNCYYISESGLNLGGVTGDSVTLTDNEAVAEATFKDGTTVPAQLNAFASSYSDYTLKSWTADSSGLPVLSE